MTKELSTWQIDSAQNGSVDPMRDSIQSFHYESIDSGTLFQPSEQPLQQFMVTSPRDAVGRKWAKSWCVRELGIPRVLQHSSKVVSRRVRVEMVKISSDPVWSRSALML